MNGELFPYVSRTSPSKSFAAGRGRQQASSAFVAHGAIDTRSPSRARTLARWRGKEFNVFISWNPIAAIHREWKGEAPAARRPRHAPHTPTPPSTAQKGIAGTPRRAPAPACKNNASLDTNDERATDDPPGAHPSRQRTGRWKSQRPEQPSWEEEQERPSPNSPDPPPVVSEVCA